MPQTLKDFLAFGKENYPAKRTAVVFWNHGGGSVSGAAFDELYGMDSLSFEEMYQAFSATFGENPQNPPVDIIGFKDAVEISSYAKNALVWAHQQGIIAGKGNDILDPKGYATRAEVATIIINYLNITEK